MFCFVGGAAGLPAFSDLDAQRRNLTMATANASHPFSNRAAKVYGMAKKGSKAVLPPSSQSQPSNPVSVQRNVVPGQSAAGAAGATSTTVSRGPNLGNLLGGRPTSSHGSGNYAGGSAGLVGGAVSTQSSAVSSREGSQPPAGQHGTLPGSGGSAMPGTSGGLPQTTDTSDSVVVGDVIKPNQIRCYRW